MAKDCDADIKCFVCKRRHHVALCEQKYGNLKPKVDAQPRKSVTPVEKTTSDTDSATSNCNCGYVNSKNTSEKPTVLLQTAIATIKNPGNPEITGNARIIFDSGSQRSFVTNRLKDSLKLPIVGRESMIIKAFGSDSNDVQICDLTTLKIKNRLSDLSVDIQALSVPFIASPIQGQSVQWAKQNYKHLANLQLADDCLSDSQADIEILIGSDNIWKFMLGEVRRGETGDSPVAVSTVLGWVLSGPAGKVPGHKLCSVNFNATHVLRIESEPVSVVSHEDVSLDSAVSSLWDLENLGILDKNSVHDEFLENIFLIKGDIL